MTRKILRDVRRWFPVGLAWGVALTIVCSGSPAYGHGTPPPNVCVGAEGVEGASWGRYEIDGPKVHTGSPVPLTHDGNALRGVGGDGWDRPLGQIPECLATTTTTVAVTTTTGHRNGEDTTTTAPKRATSTTISSARQAAVTTTSYDVGTHAPSYGPDDPELPRTGNRDGLAVLAAGAVTVGATLVLLARRKAH